MTTLPATMTGCLLLLIVSQCSAMWQDTHGAKQLEAAIAKEATALRRASNLLRSAMNPEMAALEKDADDELKAMYEERGSKYYADGTTEIAGNVNIDARPHDPRVPIGFGDPLWTKIQGTENMQISTSPYEDAALEASEAAIETVESGWVYVLGWGDTQHQSGERPDEMVTLLNAAPNKIVRRTCMGCETSHLEVYYKRITSTPSDILETLKNTWSATQNTLGTDFNLYSNYEDAVNGVNAWTYCDYNDGSAEKAFGFPGNCGPSGAVEDQWNSFQPRTGQQDVAFYVEDATVDADYRDLNEIEVIREAKLRADPDKYLSEGGCYGLHKLDKRRACYRACHYMREIFDEGTSLLCRSLMREGSVEGGTMLSALREFDGDGAEKGGKIKSTHMLGHDDGLPNTGTY